MTTASEGQGQRDNAIIQTINNDKLWEPLSHEPMNDTAVNSHFKRMHRSKGAIKNPGSGRPGMLRASQGGVVKVL